MPLPAARSSNGWLSRMQVLGSLWRPSMVRSLSVVSGADGAIAALEAKLLARDVRSKRLQTSHAFHSGMMDPILPSFAERVRRVPLSSSRDSVPVELDRDLDST